MRRIPAVRDKIERETKALNRSFELDALKRMKGLPFVTDLPPKGVDSRDIVKQVERNVYLGECGREENSEDNFSESSFDVYCSWLSYLLPSLVSVCGKLVVYDF